MQLLQASTCDGKTKGVNTLKKFDTQIVKDADVKEFQNLLIPLLEHMESDGYDCTIQYKPVIMCKPGEPDEIVYTALIVGVKEEKG